MGYYHKAAVVIIFARVPSSLKAQLYKPVQGSTAIPGPYAQQMMAQAPYVSPGHYAARAVEPGGRRSEDKEACNDPEAACDEDKFGQESKGQG